MSKPKSKWGPVIPNPIPAWRAKEKLSVDPACLYALAQLERITNIDKYCFADWVRAHERSLKEGFMFSGEPDDQAGAWLRFEYVRALGRIP